VPDKAAIPTAEVSTTLQRTSAVSTNGSSEDQIAPAPGNPPPARLNASSSSTVTPAVQEATGRKPTAVTGTTDARATTQTQTQQPVDVREVLLAAIRDAAGGKGLRKVSATYCYINSRLKRKCGTTNLTVKQDGLLLNHKKFSYRRQIARRRILRLLPTPLPFDALNEEHTLELSGSYRVWENENGWATIW